MPSGSGYGSNYAQFSSSHASQHGVMLRQKSVGETLLVFGHPTYIFCAVNFLLHILLSLSLHFRSNRRGKRTPSPPYYEIISQFISARAR